MKNEELKIERVEIQMNESEMKNSSGANAVGEVVMRIERSFRTAVTPSARVLEIASMFGLGVDESRLLQVVPPTTLRMRGGEVVFITGPSGSGKSTILRLIGEQVPEGQCLDFAVFLQAEEGNTDEVSNDGEGSYRDDIPIIERVGGSVEEATRVLSLAGLADAFVMLRSARELSDGQRYRFALARVIDFVESKAGKKNEGGITGTEGLIVILADEFGAALDRLSAAMIARNIRKWVSGKSNILFIAATTHDDFLEALDPDVLIYKPLGDGIEVLHRVEDEAGEESSAGVQATAGGAE